MTNSTTFAMSDNLLASKSILARLLASENIEVEHQPCETASFNIETRTLMLPMWEGMSNELYDMLVGHEVAHALYTPAGSDELIKAFRSIDEREAAWPVVKSYINIVEDARIERMIQDRFPGLVTDFRRGYGDLKKMNIFGDLSPQGIACMGFADRINIHYKLGRFLTVPFSSEELKMISKIDDARTWDDVVDISRELYERGADEDAADDTDSAPNPTAIDDNGSSDDGKTAQAGGDESSQDQGSGGTEPDESDSDNDSSGSSSSPSDGSGDEPTGDVAAPPSSKNGAADGGRPMKARPETEKSVEDGIKELSNSDRWDDKHRLYGTLGDVDLDYIVVPSHKITAIVHKHVVDVEAIPVFQSKAKQYLNSQNSIVSTMVKQFELKKNAKTTARTMTAKTGTLDTVKMMGYKFTDDIFRKTTIVPKGKNHGMLMFIDWSGSMCDQIGETIQQAINMALFCKRANIPFGVYAFTTSWVNTNETGQTIDNTGDAFVNVNPKKGDLGIDARSFNLLELASSSLKGNDMTDALINMVFLKDSFLNYGNNRSTSDAVKLARCTQRSALPRVIDLGGTPLDECIITAGTLAKRMRKSGVENINCIFLTDGEGGGGPLSSYNCHQYDGKEFVDQGSIMHGLTLRTNKRKIEIEQYGTKTAAFQWLRDTTGVNIVGFYLSSRLPWSPGQLDADRCNQENQLKVDKFVVCNHDMSKSHGYDAYFVLNPILKGNSMNAFDDLGEEASATKTKTAFIRQAKAKKAERNIMTLFATEVAES